MRRAAATSKRRFQTTIDSSDDDDSSDDGAISEPADEAPRKSATAVVSKDTKQKRKHVPSSSDSEQVGRLDPALLAPSSP